MPSFLDSLILKQQQCGPTLNLTVGVFANEGNESKTNQQDNLKTQTISVNEKIEFFIKFGWVFTNKNTSLDSCMTMRKKESLENPIFGINLTHNNIKKYVQCTHEWIYVSMGDKGCTFRRFVGSSFSILFYKYDITITIKEVSMSLNNKLYEDTEFTDFQLYASDGSVAVHKAMLSVHSDMFKTMLRGEWKETAEGRITMDGVTVQTLQHLKDYMYLGTLPDEGLEPLLLLAEHYLMDKLKADCISKLVTSVKPDSFEGILQFACQGSALTDLVRALIFQVPGDVIDAVQKLKIDELKDKD